MAVGIFDDHVTGLQYIPLDEEYDILACHNLHPLAQIDNPRLLARALPASKRVVRAFIGCRDFPYDDDAEANASVTSLEAPTM